MAGIDDIPCTRASGGQPEPASTGTDLSPSKPRQQTLRFRLSCLVLACVLPVWATAAFLVYHSYLQERSLMEQRVLETTRALSMVVDRELSGMRTSVTALATSPSLTSGDLAAFQRQAQAVLLDFPGGVVTVADASGQQLINTGRLYGTPLPKRANPGWVERVFKTGEPIITDLFMGSVSKVPMVGVEVPVIRDGRVVYDLALVIPAKHFDSVFSQQSVPPDWSATVTDRNNILVTRNQNAEKYVGLPSVRAYAERVNERPEGKVETANREGVPMVMLFKRSTISGWAVGIGVPAATMLGGVRRWLWWTLGGALLLSGMGLALALYFANRIAASIRTLRTPAAELGTGKLAAIPPLDLVETNELGQSLVRASQLLQQRTAERERAEKALRDSETFFRSLFENNMDAVFLARADGRVTAANPTACAMFGMTEEELRSAGRQGLAAPDDPRMALALAERSRTGKFRGELQQRRKDGTEFTAEVNSAIFSVGGELSSFVILRDITDRKRAEQALLRSEKLASVGRMAATISHEINNPLEAVTNLLYIASTGSGLSEPTLQYLKMADEELRRIAHVTRQSLGFYRESNAPAITSVGALLESAADLLKKRADAKRAVIEKRWGESVEIVAVAGELRQVFSNLLSNSLDALEEDGVIKMRVSAGRSLSNGHRVVRVTIADNGKGIDADSRSHIFEPFYTTKGSIGTGLGLWVTIQIIEKHGGIIRVRSCTNGAHKGTTFSITLPVDPATTVRGQSAGC